ncbi:MAG: hypothetical protein JRJ17_01475 [Deltaproteobacteria bacterium]|nr:hypothetical protein [Deltaproteobacteria bacterium]
MLEDLWTMRHNIRVVSTYPPRKCGLGIFSQNLLSALEDFAREVGDVKVAAIDKDGQSYGTPVDLVIDQYSPESWRRATKDIVSVAQHSSDPTIVLLQHEYGLDPDPNGNDARGTNFVEMAKELHERGFVTLVYLHTVLDSPNGHQKRILQDLATATDGLLVPTKSAVDILESPTYGIECTKIKHVDHGIRMQSPSQHDRLAIKRKYGLENRLLITTLGMHSPGKGLQYGVRAYARFLYESCTQAQRRNMVYLIAGSYHPDFVRAEGGKLYQEYRATLAQALEETRLEWCEVKELGCTDFARCDIVFLNAFLDERILVDLYAATNIMLLPYRNTQQISSGVLADTVGSGRVAIATKFRYAMELLNPESRGKQGLVIGSRARGILVDPGEASVEQIAQALDYLVFNADKRLAMERRAHRRGYEMRWDNTAWAMLQYIFFLEEERQISTGRGVTFERGKESAFERLSGLALV